MTEAPRPPQEEVTRIDPVCAIRASASVIVACEFSAGGPCVDQRIARSGAASSTSRRSDGSSCTKISPPGSGSRTFESCCALAAQSAVSAHSMRLATHSCWNRSSGWLMGAKISLSGLIAGTATAVRNPVRIRSRILSRLGFSVCAKAFSPARTK